MLTKTMINVLIVDDDDDIRDLYEKSLSFMGYKVYATARNGEEAIKNFMDYQMPVKNDLDATKEILEIDKNAKIILLSSDPYIKKKILSIGVKDFKNKPIAIKLLAETIETIIKS